MAQGGYELGGRRAVQQDGRRRLFHGIRQRSRRRLRAATHVAQEQTRRTR